MFHACVQKFDRVDKKNFGWRTKQGPSVASRNQVKRQPLIEAKNHKESELD